MSDLPPAALKLVPLPRVLVVDDERLVVDGLAARLRRRAEVVTATSGAEALLKLEAGPEFAVVLSDMRMPIMNGAQLLARVRRDYPDTVRVLLTGFADLEAALAAVNEGHVFRFLTKPCAQIQLFDALDDALGQHHLLKAEKELLEHTLKGAVDALCEVLELSNPLAFSAGRRVRTVAVAIARELGVREGLWALELAALLGQLGMVSLAPATAEKVFTNQPLDDDEQRALNRVPELTGRLLQHIPRLEPVWDLLDAARTGRRSSPLPGILRVATDYYRATTRGKAFTEAFATLDHDAAYDRAALDGLARVQGLAEKASRVLALPVSAVHPGMVLADDVYAPSGALLLVKGQLLSESVVARLTNVSRSAGVREPIKVWGREGD